MEQIEFRKERGRFFVPRWHICPPLQADKIISALLIFVMASLFESCYYFKVNNVSPTPQNISTLYNKGKTLLVHQGAKRWEIYNIYIQNDTLKGTIQPYTLAEPRNLVKLKGPNRYIHNGNPNQRYLLNEVHIYTERMNLLHDTIAAIALRDISRMNIYNRDNFTTTASFVCAGASAVIVAGLIAIAVKAFTYTPVTTTSPESCPFIYTWDGKKYCFEGEIYSGALFKPLERNDYLTLTSGKPNGTYPLKITNMSPEIQHTNLLELIVVDHDPTVSVLADKYGNLHSLSHLTKPTKATMANGKDVKAQIASKDTLFFQSIPQDNEKPLKEEMMIEFPNTEKASSVNLVIRAKTSFLLDEMMTHFFNLFGSAYNAFLQRQNNGSGESILLWMVNQGIPLSVYIERNGKWEFADFFNAAGPVKYKDDILRLSIKGNEPDPLKIKLVFGTFFWDIDYVAADYSSNTRFTTHTIPPSKAVNEKRENIISLLNKDDNSYYDQATTANQANIMFKMPAAGKTTRTIILHSKGWYERIIHPTGTPDKRFMSQYTIPGSLNQLTYDFLSQAGKSLIRPNEK
ncbi:hypothetical protein [Paludibacter jiangxiensis]|uniref:Uncharacterized protein n=1 Tax=Paludibacter jiangxiensis TaxID=681398 RepID=A0A161LXL3_9BACT|nr:hypothetical protein [Paludibacter jiangxiensis]GAT64302.1 hypothetical protein PJIAN_4852 [Paludibacter jiangxiensis]